MFNLLSKRRNDIGDGVTMTPPEVLAHPVIHSRPVNIPPTAISYRHEPIHGRDADPQTFGWYNVAEDVQLAPQPVAYTQWWNVGRDPQHAWPRMNLYQFLSPRDWLSVAQWPFSSVGHTQAGSLVTMPRGQFIPQQGRANINSPAQTTLGAQTAIRPPVVIDPNHAKLIFG
jgi:hypothetical protein